VVRHAEARPLTAEQPAQSVPESRIPIEQDDLVILGRDGETFYLVRQEDYQKSKLDSDFTEILRDMTQDDGVVLADIPRIQGIGSACVLLNLSSIRQPKARPTPTSCPKTRK
jgi:hypothetical protein